MDLFGIGPLELLLILVVALLVLGPARMVQAARGAGKTLRKVRQELRDVDPRRLIEEPLREALEEPDERPRVRQADDGPVRGTAASSPAEPEERRT